MPENQNIPNNNSEIDRTKERTWKTAFTGYNVYIFYSFILILLFFISTIFHPHSQNSLVFCGGFDFLADYINHVKYTFSSNIYTAEGAPYVRNSCVNCLSSAGERLERLFPPLAYLMLYIPRSMTAMDVRHAPMFLVAALWSIVGWSGILLMTCFAQINGETWKKVLFCFSFFLSGVMLFAIERGTLVLLSATLTAFFLFNYQSSKSWIREMSLIALALAAGLKMSPAILGILIRGNFKTLKKETKTIKKDYF